MPVAKTFAKLRQKHPKFIYESFDWSHKPTNSLSINFVFKIETIGSPDIVFKPSVNISPISKKQLNSVPQQLLENWIFNLGMIELFSYWKTTASPIIEVQAGSLSKPQLAWWKDLLIKGMGEYFYTNKIDFTQDELIKFVSKSTKSEISQTSKSNTRLGKPKYLVPIGGGKDSALVLGILDKHNLNYDVLMSEPQSPAAKKIVKISGNPGEGQNVITIKRTFDPKLFELNKQGYLNGHTPFSARLAFTSSLVALLHGHQQILLANEFSANEGNVPFHGAVINHQYSKSYEFETKFRDYVAKYLTEGSDNKSGNAPKYLSFLRPLHEIQIAKLFSQYTKYHDIFKSCNIGQQTESWCCACPKCLFVFAIMYPFIEESRLVGEIFPKNLLEDPDMVQTARELLGLEETKPFECVGTHDEVMLSFLMSRDKFKTDYPNKKLPAVLQSLKKDLDKYSLEDIEKLKQKTLLGWNEENWLSNDLKEVLEDELGVKTPDPELEDSAVVILGLGREGYSSYSFLRQKFPSKKLYGADMRSKAKLREKWEKAVAEDENLELFLGASYFKKITKLQTKEKQVGKKLILFKTPGIPKSLPEIQNLLANGAQLHSNTQLFFELCSAPIIGVTGTKGKSTTAAVIHHVLEKNGLKTILVGNIGHPALDQLPSVTPDTIVVFELSSHQLENLPYSPKIAVVQNITSEHLDYYSSTSEYQAAKFSITQHQEPDDLVIYNPEFETSNKVAVLSPGRHLRHSLKEGPDSVVFLRGDKIMHRDPDNHVVEVIDSEDLPLPGQHNLHNVMPVVIIGSLFGLKLEEIGEALKNFAPLPHRLEFVKEIEGVKYYDDSLATNPEATIKAIESFDKPMVLIAGGYERDQSFAELAKVILENNVAGVILFETEPGRRLAKELEKLSSRATLKFVDSMKKAVKLASEIIPPGGIVLMSPAAASFGMFESYKDRGEKFKKMIEGIVL